jgi:hypothetical protein
MSLNPFIREVYTVLGQSAKKELSIEELIKSFLRHSAVVSNFKSALLKYLTTAVAEGMEPSFKKALTIYQNVGTTFEERRLSMEALLLKTLEHPNCLPILVQFDTCCNLSKLVSTGNLPLVVLKLTEKLFAKR